MSGLKVLLRFEVDACLYSSAQGRTVGGIRQPSVHRSTSGDLGDLSALLGSMTVKTRKDLASIDSVNIIPAGELVGQNSLIEMTTRSERALQERPFEWPEFFPQLFLSQTPHHYLGVHIGGQFRRIDHRILQNKELSDLQRSQQPSFDKLLALLKIIKDMVVAEGKNGKLSLVYKYSTKTLNVFRRTSAANALPDIWMKRLDAGHGSTAKLANEDQAIDTSQHVEAETVVATQESKAETLVGSQDEAKEELKPSCDPDST